MDESGGKGTGEGWLKRESQKPEGSRRGLVGRGDCERRELGKE